MCRRAGSSLALDILEEVRAVLSMLADVEEGGYVVCDMSH